MKFYNLLEAGVEYQRKGIERAKEFPGKWIHFSDTQKLGIHPAKQHKDPNGIYFYPTSWIGNSLNWQGFQYGVTMKYYTIADIDMNGVLHLNKMKWQTAERIARNNNWYDDLIRIKKTPDLIFTEKNPMFSGNPKLVSTVGGMFYSIMDYLVSKENKSWASLLKGLTGLLDTGAGIINHQEPYQCVIFHKKNINIIEFGENKSMNSYKSTFQKLASDLGGRFFFKDKNMVLDVTYNNVPIQIKLEPGNFFFHVFAFFNGIWSSKRERLDLRDWDTPEDDYKKFMYAIKSTSEIADKSGVTPLNEDKIKQIVSSLFTKDISTTVTPQSNKLGDVWWTLYQNSMGSQWTDYTIMKKSGSDIYRLELISDEFFKTVVNFKESSSVEKIVMKAKQSVVKQMKEKYNKLKKNKNETTKFPDSFEKYLEKVEKIFNIKLL